MKDFYDCYRLIKENVLDEKLLKKAIQETLKNRGTEFTPIPTPSEALKTRWSGFVRKNNNIQIELE